MTTPLDKLSEKISDWNVATEFDPAVIKALIDVVRLADEMRGYYSEHYDSHRFKGEYYDKARARLDDVLKETV